MAITRAQWPHTVEDIVTSLDGIWGLVGATATGGNLMRLERSLHEPVTYTLTEYEGNDEARVLKKETFAAAEKMTAVQQFANQIGFSDN